MIGLLLSFMFGSVSGGAFCQDPIYFGELRPYVSKNRCLGVKGDYLMLFECKWPRDHTHMYCSDGTIRHHSSGYCLTTGDYNHLKYRACRVLPEVVDYQKWEVYTKEDFTDDFGIRQEKLSFRRPAYDDCMWMQSDSWKEGTLTQVHSCNLQSKKVYFFFRRRGNLLQSGYLRNQADNTKCMEAVGGHVGADVRTRTCKTKTEQQWKYYENGEIVSMATLTCLNPIGDSAAKGDDIIANACGYGKDLRWDNPAEYCDGKFLGFRNLASNKCLDVGGTDGDGDVLVYDCELRADQRFEWVSEDWTPPTAEWSTVTCNENGRIELEISNSVSYENSVTEEVAFQVETSIEESLIFETVTTSTSVSTAVASTWSHSYSETEKISVYCDNYLSGEPFKGGCMWQLSLETYDLKNRRLQWISSSITRCTKGFERPVCPPFTKCQDDTCENCIDMESSKTHDEL